MNIGNLESAAYFELVDVEIPIEMRLNHSMYTHHRALILSTLYIVHSVTLSLSDSQTLTLLDLRDGSLSP